MKFIFNFFLHVLTVEYWEVHRYEDISDKDIPDRFPYRSYGEPNTLDQRHFGSTKIRIEVSGLSYSLAYDCSHGSQCPEN